MVREESPSPQEPAKVNAPPSDAYLDAWMARWNRKLVLPGHEAPRNLPGAHEHGPQPPQPWSPFVHGIDLPADLARLLKEI